MSRRLHIVCLDAPSPPDYGGAIDMFYKIKALSESGIRISLHYFDYKPDRNANGLEEYCHKIFNYKRRTGIKGITFNKPYTVSSRINKQLIARLNEDNDPILLEGIHCTGILPFLRRQERKVIIRVHNDEAVYYQSLALIETNLLIKVYYQFESQLLRHYQKTLEDCNNYVFISESDKESFTNKYRFQNTSLIPGFVPWQKIRPLNGKGLYGLYQGNLSVAENKEAVKWLVQNVFCQVDFPFIIAGKNASQHLERTIKQYSNITLINNPSTTQMDDLVRNAQMHILPSFNKTGVKLKLLNVLFNGRFCISNQRGVMGSGLEKVCCIAETANEFIDHIHALKQAPFTEKEATLRHQLLQHYNNEANAHKLIRLLGDADVV